MYVYERLKIRSGTSCKLPLINCSPDVAFDDRWHHCSALECRKEIKRKTGSLRRSIFLIVETQLAIQNEDFNQTVCDADATIITSSKHLMSDILSRSLSINQTFFASGSRIPDELNQWISS